MGKLFKGLAKLTIAAAAVGGVCYAFKDKIKESQFYKEHDMDEKINKVKTTIKEKVPMFDNEKDFVEEDELFSDELDLELEDSVRDYVSIDPETANTEDSKEDSKEASDDSDEGEDVPTIDM